MVLRLKGSFELILQIDPDKLCRMVELAIRTIELTVLIVDLLG